MADNTTLNTGSGGDVIASDDIAGVKFQRVKLVHGADGVNAGDVATSNGLPTTETQVLADNAAFTDGTSKVFPVGYIFDETAGTALTENDVAASRIDSKRAQVSTIEDATTRGRRLTVSAELAAQVCGDLASDAVDAGNPIKVGHQARSSFITDVANADRVTSVADLRGRQMVTHIDAAQGVWKHHNSTTVQTGVAIWTPAAGKKCVVTSIVIGSYGTTLFRMHLWFGASADTTYTAGTDQLVLAASFAPSASQKPGLVFTPAYPIFAATADHILRITKDAAGSVDVAVYGYEY